MEESSKSPVFSEPGVVLHDDGTVTQVLSRAIKIKDKVIEELTYREIYAKDLEAIGAETNEHTAQIKMVAQLTDQLTTTIKGLKAVDYMRAGRIVKSLMGNEQSTGGGG